MPEDRNPPEPFDLPSVCRIVQAIIAYRALTLGLTMHNRDVPGEAPALLMARVGLAAIFLNSGYSKLTGLAGFSTYLVNHGFPSGITYPLAVLAALTELLGGLAILLGLQTRAAALVLALFVLVAALIGHRFWEAEAAQRTNQLIHFFKNIAMIGGFLALYVAGPGGFSLDARLPGRWRRRKKLSLRPQNSRREER